MTADQTTKTTVAKENATPQSPTTTIYHTFPLQYSKDRDLEIVSHEAHDVNQMTRDAEGGVAKKNPDVGKMAVGSEPIGILVLSQFFSFCSLSPSARHNCYKFFVLILTFFIYASYHMSRKPISIVKSVLNPSANSTQPGWPPFNGPNGDGVLGGLDLAFLFAYAVGMFCSGHIAERMNLRYFLTIGMIGSGFFTALFGFGRYWNIHALWFYVVVQVFAGLISSTGWPAVVTCVANWFGKGKRGLVMGLWNSHTSVGNILGALVAAAFVEYNWGMSFIVPSVIIASMGVLVFLFLVPHPQDVGCESTSLSIQSNQSVANGFMTPPSEEVSSETEVLIIPDGEVHPEPPETAISFYKALQIPGVIEFSICLFFAKLVSYTFLFWLPSYIEKTAHYTAAKAADLSTLFDVGGIVGGILAGVLSDIHGSRALTCAGMLLFAAPMLFVYEAFAKTSFALNVVFLLVCGGLVNGPYSLITTAVSADLGTHASLRGNAKALSTVTAIIDGTGSVGAALGPLLTGVLSTYGWQNVFYMLIGADICALLLLLRLCVKDILRMAEERRLRTFSSFHGNL